MDKPKLLRVGPAARMLGIHPQTLRLWTRQGRIACRYMGVRAERRYTEDDVLRLSAQVYGETETATTRRRAVLYVRVSGSTGQETSLTAQEEELRAACERDGVEAVAVVKDRASGLNERRVGLLRAISMVADDKADEIRVTHADRLARFGVDWLRSLIEAHGGTLVIEHGKSTAAPAGELLADFMALVASFSGRLYGQRSAALRRKLLATAQEMTEAQEMASS
jgi:predicted site-specific integrase-resolvase